MSLVVIAPPETPVVSLDDAKDHLRVEADNHDDDAVITRAIAAATDNLDGPGGWLGRALSPQTLSYRIERSSEVGGAGFDAWARFSGEAFSRLRLPCGPVQSVLFVTREGEDGQEVPILAPAWRLLGDELRFTTGAALAAANAVRVDYRTGYANPPPSLVNAILMMVGDLYANREGSVIDASRVTVVANPTLEALLSPLRLY